MPREICCPVDLDILLHAIGSVDGRDDGVLVENVVVTGAIEEMDHRPPRGRWHSIGILGLKDMAVCLRALASVEIYNLDGDSDRLQEDIDEQCHPQVVDLLVPGLDPRLSVALHP